MPNTDYRNRWAGPILFGWLQRREGRIRLIPPNVDQSSEAQIGVVFWRPICNEWLQRAANNVRWPVQMSFNLMKHDHVVGCIGSFTSSGCLTPSDDLTQWDANSLFFFFLLYFFKCKQKTECCVVMAGDSGLKNLQRSDTNCWGQGRQCGRSHSILWRRRTCV